MDMQHSQHRKSATRRQVFSDRGFTLLEILIVLTIIGILTAIAAPSWMKFMANRRVTVARDELRQAIQQAQAASIAQRNSWRFSLREREGYLEWAIHPDEQNWQEVQVWQALNSNVVLEESDTTLWAGKDGVYSVRFGFKGEVKSRLGTVTLSSKGKLAQNRCIIISTLLGATRNGKERLFPNKNGRQCY